MINENISFQTVEYMQQRIEELSTENARMREALTMVDDLIKHQFSGSHRAMSDLMLAAQTAFFALNGFYDIEAGEHLKSCNLCNRQNRICGS